MMKAALGLPLEMAKQLFAGQECVVETTLPPRKLDKKGCLRVVRAAKRGEAVVLTVSPFEDTVDTVEAQNAGE